VAQGTIEKDAVGEISEVMFVHNARLAPALPFSQVPFQGAAPPLRKSPGIA